MKNQKICISKSVALISAVVLFLLAVVMLTNYVNTQKVASDTKAAEAADKCTADFTLTKDSTGVQSTVQRSGILLTTTTCDGRIASGANVRDSKGKKISDFERNSGGTSGEDLKCCVPNIAPSGYTISAGTSTQTQNFEQFSSNGSIGGEMKYIGPGGSGENTNNRDLVKHASRYTNEDGSLRCHTDFVLRDDDRESSNKWFEWSAQVMSNATKYRTIDGIWSGDCSTLDDRMKGGSTFTDVNEYDNGFGIRPVNGYDYVAGSALKCCIPDGIFSEAVTQLYTQKWACRFTDYDDLKKNNATYAQLKKPSYNRTKECVMSGVYTSIDACDSAKEKEFIMKKPFPPVIFTNGVPIDFKIDRYYDTTLDDEYFRTCYYYKDDCQKVCTNG